jgi:hypothetical protein
VSHRFPLFLASLVLALGLPGPAAVAGDPTSIEAVRGPKSAIPGDFLGAVHPDVEVTARVIGGARGGLWSARAGEAAPVELTGTASELRRLLDLGLVGGLQITLDMWEAGVISEGVSGSEVEAYHGAGLTGRGTKIAILDSSFSGYADQLGTELPASLTTASFHFEGLERGFNRHGTAVAELVHDVAPGAELFLVNADANSLDAAVDYFIAQGVDVVNLSGGWSVGPFDGTAEQDAEVNRAIDAGIVWVNAAGNEADQHFASTYTDSDTDGWADLSGGVEINDFFVPAGDEFQIVLNWTDPTTDLDLCLWDLAPSGGGVAQLECSEGLQNAPWHQPLEVITWINTGADTHHYGFSIGGDPLDPATGTSFDVYTNVVLDLALQTPESSLLVPNATERVISVGAVPHFDHAAIESYSSRGPTADGRVKPDLVGPDRVTTATFGEFSGTSAAAPFVAGLVALYLSMHPGATPVDVRRELGLLADGAGKDNTFGWGYARLEDPGGDRVAFQDPATGLWTLRMPDGRDTSFYYGIPDDVAIMCDSNGDGIDTPALYRRSTGYVYLRFSNDFGLADVSFYYGIPGDIPICGDWNGDGTDTVGIFRPSEGKFYLRNRNTQGTAGIIFHFGAFGDVPLAGDWDGDGIDTVGVYRPSNGFVYVTNEHRTKFADDSALYGVPGDRLVVGDWDGDGADSVGIFRPSEATFYLSNVIGDPAPDRVLQLGDESSMPVAGTFE